MSLETINFQDWNVLQEMNNLSPGWSWQTRALWRPSRALDSCDRFSIMGRSKERLRENFRNPPGFEGQGPWVFYKATLCRCYSGKFDGLAIPNSVRILWFNMSILPIFIFFVFPSLFSKNDPQGLKSPPAFVQVCLKIVHLQFHWMERYQYPHWNFCGYDSSFSGNPTCKRYTPMVVGQLFEGMMVERMKSLWKFIHPSDRLYATNSPTWRIFKILRGDRERFSSSLERCYSVHLNKHGYLPLGVLSCFV